MAYLRPQDRHAHRTQGSTHAMSAEDQLIGLSFCGFFRWNQQTAGFTPRNWLVFGWFFSDVSPSFSENEKGVFSGSLGRLFFISYRVLQKKQPHRHQEVLLQHPLHPQLNVEVSYNERPGLLKWLFFLKAVVYTRCAQHWIGGRGARTAPYDRVCVGGCFFWRTRTTSCDKELQTWHQWKKWRQGSGSHSANSAKGLWQLHCRACTAKSHPSAQALCRLRTLQTLVCSWTPWLLAVVVGVAVAR